MLRRAVRPFFRRVVAQEQLWRGRAMMYSGMFSGDRQRWVAVWGNGDFGRLGSASTESCWEPSLCQSMQNLQPVAVACGGAHTLVLTEEGRVYTSGLNDWGQLGLPLSTGYSMELMEVVGFPDDAKIVHVAAGDFHSAAVSENGRVYMWGRNTQGQLGLGKRAQSKMWKVAAGLTHSACLDEQGSLYTFGKGRECQLGLGVDRDFSEPMRVPILPPIEEIACGGYHTGSISRNGQLYMWGSNEYGCLGFGYKQQNATKLPMLVEGILAPLRVTQVECGWKHTLALTVEGDIYSWGWGGSQGTHGVDGLSSGGQLGLGNENDFFEPTHVKLKNMKAVQLSCGFNHSAAILEEQ